MKQYVIVILAVVLIILLNIYQINYLESSSRYILSDLEDIKNAINRNDYEEVYLSTTQLKETFKNVESGWDIFGEHDDIKQINEHISRMLVYARYKEESDLAMEIANLETLITHVINAEKLSFSNVL